MWFLLWLHNKFVQLIAVSSGLRHPLTATTAKGVEAVENPIKPYFSRDLRT